MDANPRIRDDGGGCVYFLGVAVDSSGYVYAAGVTGDGGTYDFGNGQAATGTFRPNVLLVKYNTFGLAQWAQTLTSGSSISGAAFGSVAVDSSGNVYAAGSCTGTTAFGFGNSIAATGSSSGNNALLVKYNSSGNAQWAQTNISGTGSAEFKRSRPGLVGQHIPSGRLQRHRALWFR